MLHRNTMKLTFAVMILLTASLACSSFTVPTATPVILPDTPPAPTTAPTLAPTLVDTAASPASTAVPIPEVGTTMLPTTSNKVYAVVLVKSGDELNVRQQPGAGSAIVSHFAPDARDITATGKTLAAGNQTWMEIYLRAGGTGWVDSAYLTEQVSSDQFCADARVSDLLDNLAATFMSRDGNAFRSWTSPMHGLTLQLIHGGKTVNYTPDEAGWLFNSTYKVDWGAAAGSGLPVNGTFSEIVLPKLLDVFSGEYTRQCNQVLTGGASYDTSRKPEVKNINFYSAYRPGPKDQELNWRTWIVGIEYVDGKPYLFSLDHFDWEP